MRMESRLISLSPCRILPFLLAVFFVTALFFLSIPVQAVKHSQDKTPSLEESLARIQAQYDAALYDSYSQYSVYFEKVYKTYPVIPKGTLEGISYSQTSFYHRIPKETDAYPNYGLMGLMLDGKGVFSENLILVSDLSGYSIDEIKDDPEIHLMAFAGAYVALRNQLQIVGKKIEDHIPILIRLSIHPDNKLKNDFATDTYVYSVLSFLNNVKYQSTFDFPPYNIDLIKVFGEDNYKVLSSNYITASNIGNNNSYGMTFIPASQDCPYPSGMLLRPGHACRRDSDRQREPSEITGIIIHATDGLSFNGLLQAWESCPDRRQDRVAAHYLISLEGQIVQAYNEREIASHAGGDNSYTIGIEHVGRADFNDYTAGEYAGSAALVKAISCRYGIDPKSTYFGFGTGPQHPYLLPDCLRIKGHQHSPGNSSGHYDPGANWNWFDYYRLINGGAEPPFTRPAETRTRCSGNLASEEEMVCRERDFPVLFKPFLGTDVLNLIRSRAFKVSAA